jgi:hypothetical protein
LPCGEIILDQTATVFLLGKRSRLDMSASLTPRAPGRFSESSIRRAFLNDNA